MGLEIQINSLEEMCDLMCDNKLPERRNMTFKVIDRKTGKEPTHRVIQNIAKKQGLMEMDIDQFFLGEDGQLVLADDCGRVAYLDMERFKPIIIF